jgi:DNA-binding MarR family transcriptional regulator
VSARRSSVFLEVFALSQAVRQLLQAAMAGASLTPEEYALYSVVFEDELVTPTDISRRLALPKTTVMERVRAMEERGHVRRVANARDGRSYHLTLSASGLAAHKESNLRFEDAYRAFVREFGGDLRRAEARLTQLRAAVTAASLKREAGRAARPRRSSISRSAVLRGL